MSEDCSRCGIMLATAQGQSVGLCYGCRKQVRHNPKPFDPRDATLTARVAELTAEVAVRDATIVGQAGRMAELEKDVLGAWMAEPEKLTLLRSQITKFEAFARQYRGTMARKHMDAIEAVEEFSKCNRLCDEAMHPGEGR